MSTESVSGLIPRALVLLECDLFISLSEIYVCNMSEVTELL